MKEKSQNLFKQLNKTGLIIALVHWVITFFTDHIIFQYVQWDFSNAVNAIKTIMTYGAKLVFLALLIFIWQYSISFIKTKNKVFKFTTLFYFVFLYLLILLTWPGIWRMDEFGILNSATILIPVFWQNYLTSLFYVFSLMILPIPTGIIIVQCVLISLVAGSIISYFVKKFGKMGYFAVLPLLFFPVLDSNLYPMRMSLYAFLELLLILFVYEIYENCRSGKALTNVLSGKWIFTGILAAIVTVWRTEAIYYILLFPLLLWILFHKLYTKKTLGKILLLYLSISLCMFIPQKLGDKLTSGNQYDLTSVVLPLAPMVEKAYDDVLLGDENAKALLQNINRVIDVEITYEGVKNGKSGINLFWGVSGFQKEGYSDEDYKTFKNGYYKLIMKYPEVFAKERLDCFLNSKDLLQNTTELFEAEGVVNYEQFKNYTGTKPISNSVRTNTIKVLECRDITDYEVKNGSYGVVYSHLIPIVLLLFVWGFCFVKRKWAEFFVVSLPLVKVPLIFLTAPSRLFMYYYSLYLIGYFVFAYILLLVFSKIWKKVGGTVNKTIRYAKRNGIKAAYYAAKERTDHVHVDTLTKKALQYKGSKTESDYLLEGGDTSDASSISYKPLISIVVPTYETKKEFLVDLLDCVTGQIYENWELVLADASKTDAVKNIVAEYPSKSEKIRYIKLEKNDGISNNTNAAIMASKGDYIALFDHDDLITKDALYHMVKCLNEAKNSKDFENVVAIYSNEDKCNSDASIYYEPYFKPDFNLDLLQSNNYICHFLMVKASIMKELQLRSKFDGAQDYDLVLRLAEKGKILHVPYVIYHWRCHEGSTASNTDSKLYAYDAGRRALIAHFERIGLSNEVVVTDSAHLGFYDVTYKNGIFNTRKDVAAICGRVVENGIVVGSPDHLFDGLKEYSSGYMHRADLYMDVNVSDERALKLREDLNMPLNEALNQGMYLVYDPHYVVK